jgi:hypothetical protein
MSARRPLSGKPDIAADMAVGPLLTPIRTLARDAGAPCWCWRSSSHLDSERFRPVQRTCGPLLWQAQRAVADCGGVKPMSGMRRRQFMTLLGGRMRRIGVLLSTREGDPQRRAQLAAFVQRLMELGWIDSTMRASTSAGPQAVSTLPANTRRNWSRSRRASSSPIPASTWPARLRRRDDRMM